MAKRWLVKTEPSTYAYADLAREGRTAWTGVKNTTAQLHLRAMRLGDEVLVYHTGDEKAVVGTAHVAKAPYPDPTAAGTKLVCVDLVPLAPLPAHLPLARIKTDPVFAGWDLLRISRLSVMPVPDPIWARVLTLSSPSR